MIEVSLTVKKSDVYDEVAKTTAYTGAKMEGDENAYERIFTTDADQQMLERFWHECQVDACETLKKFLQSEEERNGEYTLHLALSQSFDTALEESMGKELFSFFVTGIAAKWYTFTNKKEAADYIASAQALLVGIHRKALYKRKPTRPTY